MPMVENVLLDVETCAIDGVEAYIEPASAPANYKDPEKIAAYIADAKVKAIRKAALKPDLGRIVCVSWQLIDRDLEPRAYLCKTEADEAKVLEKFWDDLTMTENHYRRIVTFGGHRFDLPMLMRRSLCLRVQYPHLRVDRGSPHLDLYRLLTFDDAIDGYPLTFYLKRYGLDADITTDPYTGADIEELVVRNQWHDIQVHCTADVERLYALAEWMGVINVRPDEEIGF